MVQSVCPSHLFDYVTITASSWNFQEVLPMTKVMSMQKDKVRGQRSRSSRSWPHLTVSGPYLQFEFTYCDEMMHTAWCCLAEVPYCFFSCDQAALWMVFSVRLSVCLSVRLSVCHTFLTMFPSSYHHEIFRKYYQWQKWRPCKRSRSEVKGQGHRGQHPT